MLKERLKLERMSKNISQRKLGEVIGVSQQTIGSWETGRTQPDQESLKQLSQFFGTSLDYLLGESDIRNPIDIKPISTERYMSNLDMDITNDINSLMNKLNHAIHFGNIKPLILDDQRLPATSALLLRFALDVAIKQIKDINLKSEHNNSTINLNEQLKDLTSTEGITKKDWDEMIGLKTSSPINPKYLSNSQTLLKYIGEPDDVEDLYVYALDALDIKNEFMRKASTDVQLNFLMAVLDDIEINKYTNHCKLTFKSSLGSSNHT